MGMAQVAQPLKTEKLNKEESFFLESCHIKLSLTRQHVKKLESICDSLVQKAQTAQKKVKGPIRLPTKKMTITTRRSPNGEGTNTWDKFQMRLHKRVVYIYAPTVFIKEVMEIFGDPAVEVE